LQVSLQSVVPHPPHESPSFTLQVEQVLESQDPSHCVTPQGNPSMSLLQELPESRAQPPASQLDVSQVPSHRSTPHALPLRLLEHVPLSHAWQLPLTQVSLLLHVPQVPEMGWQQEGL
jgi:hypothetical protein